MKRVLLVEDDPWQADAIEEVLRDRARQADIDLEVTWANSEAQAHERVVSAQGCTTQYDAYIVDMMLPWSQDDNPPEPEDPAVLGPGGMTAGLRLVGLIKKSRGRDPRRNAPSPIFLYSVIDNKAVRNIGSEQERVFYLPKTENDNEIAAQLVRMLKD